jgi:hypothetical protein
MSEDLLDFFALIAFGSARAVKKRFGTTPSMRDRLAAASELANRLHGRPVQAIDIDDERPAAPVFVLPEGTSVAMK